jgi:DNA-directed RNA polymerase specialized sigma24 family protein
MDSEYNGVARLDSPEDPLRGATMPEIDLSDLSTQWSNIFRAREAEGDAGAAARNALLLRYHEVVLRYLRAALRDEHAINHVCSNFSVRILEADRFLQTANPRRGRFRDYLKAVLRHMVTDYYREQQREHKQLEKLPRTDAENVESDSKQTEEDQRFLTCWRQELINWMWQELERVERRTGQPYAVLMRLQTQQPDLRSSQLAELLSVECQRPFTAAGVRQLLHRGRELVGDLLVAEVARSLQVDCGDPDGAARVEQELIELGLLFSYCKKALERCRAER